MEMVEDLGSEMVKGQMYKFAMFLCPVCNKKTKKIKRDGLKAKQCSHKCYSKTRTGVRRGAYLDFVIVSGYRYRYAPKHPNATGTKKLYVAEHRLVVESVIGRLMTDREVVHHKDGNTLNNSPENLQLMGASEHNTHHSKNRKRSNDGKFTV